MNETNNSETESNHRRALIRWLQIGEDETDTDSKSTFAKPVRISEQLEEWFWLYCDGILEKNIEDQMWRLAAEEPGARARLRQILEVQAESSHWEPLPFQTVPQQGTPPEATGAAGRSASGVVVTLLKDGLTLRRRSGQAVSQSYAMARSAGEAVTSASDEQKLESCIVLVEVSQRSASECDVFLKFSHIASDISQDQLQVELHGSASSQVVSQPFENEGVSFPRVQKGTAVIALASESQIVEQFVIDVKSDDVE
jgi:hypothetical protein